MDNLYNQVILQKLTSFLIELYQPDFLEVNINHLRTWIINKIKESPDNMNFSNDSGIISKEEILNAISSVSDAEYVQMAMIHYKMTTSIISLDEPNNDFRQFN